MRSEQGFPFPAVLGVTEAKRAIMVALVSPDIHTVMIQGVSGSAKTTLVRSIPEICDLSIFNLPINTNEGQVFGSLDIEGTLLNGERKALPGVLERANGNILYVDDANLMERSLLGTILDAILCHNVVVERDGLSWEYDCNLKFIGTMNIFEAPLHPHILDRFDICVRLEHLDDEESRYEIVRRKISFDSDEKKFCEQYSEEQTTIKKSIQKAKERLQYVVIPDEIINVMAELCSKLGIEGHRGDLAIANTSKSLAALAERDEVTLDDVKEAAHMCLGHRMTEIPSDDNDKSSSESGNEPPQSNPPDMSPTDDNGQTIEKREEKNKQDGKENSIEDKVFSVGNTFSVIDFVSLKPLRNVNFGKGTGRHEKTRGSGESGRYIGSTSPKSGLTNIAFDASIRAAAPYQKYRKKEGLALVLESQDLRQKVMERKNGISVMFLVDASGSMGVKKRMISVKGAVFSLLQESYKNRDKVGLISFRKDHTEILLPFTKSVDFAYRKLKEMPTGGTTPLAAALLKAHLEIGKETRMNPGEKCFVVLTTDGRANIPITSDDPFNDALRAAGHIGAENTARWIVVDTGTGYPHIDNALKICDRLNGIYLKLEELNSFNLAHKIKTIVKGGNA